MDLEMQEIESVDINGFIEFVNDDISGASREKNVFQKNRLRPKETDRSASS